MGACYCDSSALVKRYANETGGLWVRNLTDPQAGNDICLAHTTGIEFVAAMARKTRAPTPASWCAPLKRHYPSLQTQ